MCKMAQYLCKIFKYWHFYSFYIISRKLVGYASIFSCLAAMSLSRSDIVTQFVFLSVPFFSLVFLESVVHFFLYYRVSMMFQESLMDVWSLNGVSRMFQESFYGVHRKFQGCFKEVSRVFQGSLKSVSRKFGECFN